MVLREIEGQELAGDEVDLERFFPHDAVRCCKKNRMFAVVFHVIVELLDLGCWDGCGA